jgi:hypothetical protein
MCPGPPSLLLISLSSTRWPLLALTTIKPVSILFSLLYGPWENIVLLKCRHQHSVPQSSNKMSLDVTGVKNRLH